MEQHQEEEEEKLATIHQSETTPVSLLETTKRIPKLIDKDDVIRMIDLQVAAIDRLEKTNNKLVNCNALAQAKLATTAKLFKKTAKQMSDSKKDLDIVYRKITELKSKIRSARPDLNANEPNVIDSDCVDDDDGTVDEAKEAITNESAQSI